MASERIARVRGAVFSVRINLRHSIQNPLFKREMKSYRQEIFGINPNAMFFGPSLALVPGISEIRVSPEDMLNWNFQVNLKQAAQLYG